MGLRRLQKVSKSRVLSEINKSLDEDWLGHMFWGLPPVMIQDIRLGKGYFLTSAPKYCSAEDELRNVVWVYKYEY